jgi:S1-C subfamily serine protease
VSNSDAFNRKIGHASTEAPSTLTVFRDHKRVEVQVTPKRRPTPQLAVNRQTQRYRWRGITLSSVPQNWTVRPGASVPGGVYVIGIEDAEAGKKLGIKPGQIITGIAGKTVKSLTDLQKLLDSIPPDAIKIDTADSATLATAQ